MKKINLDQNLIWLQELYVVNTYNIRASFPQFISDEQLKDYTPLHKIPPSPWLLKIDTLDNPGWSLKFFYKDTFLKEKNWTDIDINCGSNLIDEDSNDWLSVNKNSAIFNGVGGPLCLTAILEAFHCWVEELPFVADDLLLLRSKLKQINPLLSWLEEFYYSCCDEDWEHTYGCSIINVASGWVMVFSLDYLELEDSTFNKIIIEEKEGLIECYKVDYKFIIRTHPRGLIQGIDIFKKWVEIELDKLNIKNK